MTPKGAAFVTILGMSLACSISVVLFFEVGLSGSPCYIKLSPWLDCEMFDACWGFYFDSLTVSMCFTVTLISTLVHLYSTSYMSHDPHTPRFMSYLSLFTFAMLTLVTADNFLQLFFGWEGVGLCSYLLIGFWYKKESANNAAIKAFIVNRIGDFGLAIGIFLIYFYFGTINFDEVFQKTPELLKENFLF